MFAVAAISIMIFSLLAWTYTGDYRVAQTLVLYGILCAVLAVEAKKK